MNWLVFLISNITASKPSITLPLREFMKKEKSLQALLILVCMVQYGTIHIWPGGYINGLLYK